jgi:hypothetical protein
MKPFFRPQRKQRRTILEENFGFLFARATTDVFAICLEMPILRGENKKALKKLCPAILANDMGTVKYGVWKKNRPA